MNANRSFGPRADEDGRLAVITPDTHELNVPWCTDLKHAAETDLVVREHGDDWVNNTMRMSFRKFGKVGQHSGDADYEPGRQYSDSR